MKTDQPFDIVVVGASAGGVRALQNLVAPLPLGLDAAVFVVLHLQADMESHLPAILCRAGRLPATHPKDGQHFETGAIYIAPPNRHLFLQDSGMRVLRGPKENLHRPAIDVLFRSAAMIFGPRVIGVLLTGGDDDGAAGMKLIQERGGVLIVQDPADSEHPTMPQSAIFVAEPDFIAPIDQIGPLVRDLVNGDIKPTRRSKVSEPTKKTFGQEMGLPTDVSQLGIPTAFSCPECNGTLWELLDGELLRYRCRVGHMYSTQSVMKAEADAVERALWEAIRVLEESAAMSRRIASKTPSLRERLMKKAEERQRFAEVLRNLELNEPELPETGT